MRTCSGIKTNGERCRAQAMRDSQWCLNHHPDRAEENRRRSSKGGKKGGRGRPQVALTNIKTQLQDLADGVLDGSINRADGATVSQILNVLLRAITVELQVKEQQELIERLEALEAAEEARSKAGGTIWGA
jgi:hypothetical protein